MLCMKGRIQKHSKNKSTGTVSVFWDKDECFV